jgi:hypothetical protein
MTTILHAPTLDLARTLTPTATVEAEYGSEVIPGTVATVAHHQASGPFSPAESPAPCNDDRIVPLSEGDGSILVSHLDLDTVGGCLRLMGRFNLFRPEFKPFWALSEFVDLRGPHRISEAGASETNILRLNAYWAWAKTNIPRLPRDQIADVSKPVDDAGIALQNIFMGELGLLAGGRAFMEAEADLNRRTLVRREGKVLYRVATLAADFCNHLYASPEGTPFEAVVCRNSEMGSVTISLAVPHPGVSCRDIVQGLWGPEAGGHPGIAGGPRGKALSEDDANAAIQALNRALS